MGWSDFYDRFLTSYTVYLKITPHHTFDAHTKNSPPRRGGVAVKAKGEQTGCLFTDRLAAGRARLARPHLGPIKRSAALHRNQSFVLCWPSKRRAAQKRWTCGSGVSGSISGRLQHLQCHTRSPRWVEFLSRKALKRSVRPVETLPFIRSQRTTSRWNGNAPVYNPADHGSTDAHRCSARNLLALSRWTGPHKS